MSTVDAMDAPSTTPAALSADERTELTRMLDEFLSDHGQKGRSLVPVSEVTDLALDMRRVLNPAPG